MRTLRYKYFIAKFIDARLLLPENDVIRLKLLTKSLKQHGGAPIQMTMELCLKKRPSF